MSSLQSRDVSEQDRSEALVDESATADQNGQTRHCYQGLRPVGADTIHAYANNGNQDPDETT